MKRILALCITFLTVDVVLAAPTAFFNVNVIPMTGDEVIAAQTVIVEGGVITIDSLTASWSWHRLLTGTPRLESLAVRGIVADLDRELVSSPGVAPTDDDPTVAGARDLVGRLAIGVGGRRAETRQHARCAPGDCCQVGVIACDQAVAAQVF